MINLKEFVNYLANKKPFQASNIFACLNEKSEYIVYSYQTIILRLNSAGEVEYFDGGYYSRTTSKLQNKIKQAFNL
jgi:hypothetical protein